MGRADARGGGPPLHDRDRRTTTPRPFAPILTDDRPDDRRVLHGVSATEPADGVREGVRDMLLSDHFPRADSGTGG
jgi:hypothetical protein